MRLTLVSVAVESTGRGGEAPKRTREGLGTLGISGGETALCRDFVAYAGVMSQTAHLRTICELRDIRRERPRVSGETEDQYFQRLAQEFGRRERARRRGLIVRVLRRDSRR
jgi:hypothetical protein